MTANKSKKRIVIAVVSAAVVLAAALFAFVFGSRIYERFFTPDIPLSVTSSPNGITVENGYSAVFNVVANGKGLEYSWEYTSPNGTVAKIKGNVGSRLSLVTDMSMNGNVYRCTVTDLNGASMTTDGAVLTVTKDHTFGERLVTKENTCLNDGEATYVCSSCGEKKNEVLPARGHDFSESVSYTGKRLFVCKVCSYSFETDAADKSALDEALKEIPEYVSVYYGGNGAKSLAAIRDKLDSTVYGVKNYDLLSQKETDDYAERINSALKKLTLRKSDGKNIYISSGRNGSAVLSATDGQAVRLEEAAVTLTDAGLYEDTKKKSYNLTLPDGKKLFSSDSAELLLLSLAADPALMRTPLVYNAADRLGISEAPAYDMAEVWLDGEYLGLYAVRSAPDALSEKTADLRDGLLEVLSSGAAYEKIKERVDTARFARFMILYCAMGLSDTVDADSLLFESDGKISIHIPTVCDGILRPDSQPNFAQEIMKSDILSALLHNSDFMTETRYVYALSSEKIMNLCAESDTEESDRTVSEEGTTVPPAAEAAAEAETETAENDGDKTEKSVEAVPVISDAGNENMSSFARFKEKYGSAIKRNFADGAVTYSDSFGRITRFATFDENAHALAAALRARLVAADNYFTA